MRNCDPEPSRGRRLSERYGDSEELCAFSFCGAAAWEVAIRPALEHEPGRSGGLQRRHPRRNNPRNPRGLRPMGWSEVRMSVTEVGRQSSERMKGDLAFARDRGLRLDVERQKVEERTPLERRFTVSP